MSDSLPISMRKSPIRLSLSGESLRTIQRGISPGVTEGTLFSDDDAILDEWEEWSQMLTAHIIQSNKVPTIHTHYCSTSSAGRSDFFTPAGSFASGHTLSAMVTPPFTDRALDSVLGSGSSFLKLQINSSYQEPIVPFRVGNVSTVSSLEKQFHPHSTQQSRALLFRRALGLQRRKTSFRSRKCARYCELDSFLSSQPVSRAKSASTMSHGVPSAAEMYCRTTDVQSRNRLENSRCSIDHQSQERYVSVRSEAMEKAHDTVLISKKLPNDTQRFSNEHAAEQSSPLREKIHGIATKFRTTSLLCTSKCSEISPPERAESNVAHPRPFEKAHSRCDPCPSSKSELSPFELSNTRKEKSNKRRLRVSESECDTGCGAPSIIIEPVVREDYDVTVLYDWNESRRLFAPKAFCDDCKPK